LSACLKGSAWRSFGDERSRSARMRIESWGECRVKRLRETSLQLSCHEEWKADAHRHHRPAVVTSTTLEARLARLEAELDLLRLTSRSHDSRLGHLEEPKGRERSSSAEGKLVTDSCKPSDHSLTPVSLRRGLGLIDRSATACEAAQNHQA